MGFSPFKSPRFHLPPPFSSSLAIEEDTVQAAVMPHAPGYFLVRMRTLKHLDGVFTILFMIDARLFDSLFFEP